MVFWWRKLEFYLLPEVKKSYSLSGKNKNGGANKKLRRITGSMTVLRMFTATVPTIKLGQMAMERQYLKKSMSRSTIMSSSSIFKYRTGTRNKRTGNRAEDVQKPPNWSFKRERNVAPSSGGSLVKCRNTPVKPLQRRQIRWIALTTHLSTLSETNQWCRRLITALVNYL